LTDEGKISRRLAVIADLLQIGRRPADIGCDHAYVPILLCEQNRIEGAIAADVREAPLSIAAENIRKHGFSDRIVTRLSDGFSEISPGEIDSALIAGMGGMLICRILNEGSEVLPSLRELIVEPQSDVDQVRRLLTEGGAGVKFRIDDERLVLERGKYYPVIHAVPSGKEAAALTQPELLYGPVLLAGRDPVLREYLDARYRKLCEIDQTLLRVDAPENTRTAQRKNEIREEIACCEAALKYYEVQ
jgi:tRNA (adenine22-N1)-methyltransferase